MDDEKDLERTQVGTDHSPPDPESPENTPIPFPLTKNIQSIRSSPSERKKDPATSTATSTDSPAEPGKTPGGSGSVTVNVNQNTDPPIKRGPGRPRQDGLPVHKAASGPHPTPTPRFKQFWSDAPNGDQKPQKFLNWAQEVPSWVRERLVMYVNRVWPALVHIDLEEKDKARATGETVEHNYIDKLAGVEFPKTILEFQDKYGAGDYHLLINDDMVEKRTLCNVNIREGWRDIRTFPPSDRRIDDVRNVSMTERANQPYIQYLRGKGKLPEQQVERGREADMAEATALTQMTSLVRDVVATNSKKGEDAGGTARILDVLADAAKKGNEIIADSVKQAESMRAEAPRPMENLKEMIEVVDKLRPPQQTDSGMMGMFMSQIMDMNKTIMTLQNQRIEFAEKMVMDMRNNPQGGGAGGGGGQGQQGGGTGDNDPLTGGVEKLMKVATALGWKIPGRGAAAEVLEKAGGGWQEALPEILQAVNGLLATGVNAYQTKVYADAVAKGQVNPQHPPPPMQAQPQAQARPGLTEGVDAAEDGIGMGPGGTNPADEAANYMRFMGEITRPILNHINRNLGGAQFAEFLIDMYDEATYAQVKAGGADTLIMALNTYPPIASQIQGKELVVKKFVADFINADDILNQAAAGESGDGHEDEEEETGTSDGIYGGTGTL